MLMLILIFNYLLQLQDDVSFEASSWSWRFTWKRFMGLQNRI